MLAISNHNSSERCLIKLPPWDIFIWKKYIYILALKMANPGNQLCASCIGTVSLPVVSKRPNGLSYWHMLPSTYRFSEETGFFEKQFHGLSTIVNLVRPMTVNSLSHWRGTRRRRRKRRKKKGGEGGTGEDEEEEKEEQEEEFLCHVIERLALCTTRWPWHSSSRGPICVNC